MTASVKQGLIVGGLVLVFGVGAYLLAQHFDTTGVSSEPISDDIAAVKARESLKGMPLVFQENRGQVDNQVKYLVRASGTSIFFTPEEVVFQLVESPAEQDPLNPVESSASTKAVALRQTFVGGKAPYEVIGVHELQSKVNYFIGNDESKWVRGAPTFAGVKYAQVYEGIDVTYDGSLGRLNYVFTLQPQANPNVIRFSLLGADTIALAQDGALVFVTPLGNVAWPKPVGKQGDVNKHVDAEFVLIDDTTVGFSVGTYDRNQPLTIQSFQ